MYIQYKKPDAAALAAMITNLRGDRTLATFAEDIKRTTPSIKGPLYNIISNYQ